MNEIEQKVLELLESGNKSGVIELVTDLQKRGEIVEKLYSSGYLSTKEQPVQRAGIGNKVSYINYNAIYKTR